MFATPFIAAVAALYFVAVSPTPQETIADASFGVLMSNQNPDYNALNDDRNVKDKIGDAGWGDHKAYFDALEAQKAGSTSYGNLPGFYGDKAGDLRAGVCC